MIQPLPIGPFLGVFSALGVDAPPGSANDALNVRVGDGKLRPRYGYRKLQSSQHFEGAVYGLERLNGWDQSNNNVEEWVSIETVSSAVKPFSLNKTTGARTEITNGGSPLSLQASAWRAVVFGGNSYFVNPDSNPSIYKHVVGTSTSWTSLASLAAPASPTVTYLDASLNTLALNATGSTLSTDGTVATSASVESGTNGTFGTVQSAASTKGRATVTLDFGAGHEKDWTKHDVLYFQLRSIGNGAFAIDSPTANDGIAVLAPAVSVTLVNAASKSIPSTQVVYGGSLGTFVAYFDPKTRADWAQIRKVQITYSVTGSDATATNNKIEFGWIQPCYIDLAYSDATKSDITIGLTYYNSSTSLESAMTSVTISRSFLTSARTEMGSRIVSVFPFGIQLGFASSPNADKVRVYLADSGAYYLMDEILDTATPWQPDMSRREATLGAIYNAGSFASQTGIVAGFAYKGWVVWLYQGGYQSVKHSRVGQPEALASSTDLTTDDNRGATFSLSDNYADSPVGGVQAGDVVLIAGHEGVYVQVGDSPSAMSPPRRIPGSIGCAGRFAFSRFKSDAGDPGLAWMDPNGWVWFAGSYQSYVADATARPVELSSAIRDKLRKFLLDDQASEFGFVDLSPALMGVDEATASLWIVMGRRAAVLRPPSLINDTRQWELYEYNLTTASRTDTSSFSETGIASGSPSSLARTGSTDAWTNMTNIYASDDVYATSGPIDSGDKTEKLRVVLTPSPALPVGAVLTGLQINVERSATGQIHVLNDLLQPLLSGANAGSNLAANALVPSSDAVASYTVDVAGIGLTAAQANAGSIAVDIGYVADPTSGTVWNSGNWTLASSNWKAGAPDPGPYGNSWGVHMTATWTGGGSAPSYVILRVTINVSSGSQVAGPGATYSVDNGQGATASGTGSAVASNTVDHVLAVVGGVATLDITQSRSNSSNVTWNDFSGPGTPTMSVQTPTSATVRIDQVTALWSWTTSAVVAGTSVGVGWSYLAYSPTDRKLWCLRSSGDLDENEWNSSTGAYIQGSSRDGGNVMPAGYWESREDRGANKRLTHFAVDRSDPTQGCTVTAYCDRVPAGTVLNLAANSRWGRFGVGQSGWNHRFRFAVTEGLTGIDRAEARYAMLSQGLAR